MDNIVSNRFNLLIEEGYRYAGNGELVKLYTRKDNIDIMVTVNLVENMIRVYNAKTTDKLCNKLYANDLHNDSYINFINYIIKRYIE